MAEMTQKYVLLLCLNVNRLNIFFEAQGDFLFEIVKKYNYNSSMSHLSP